MKKTTLIGLFILLLGFVAGVIALQSRSTTTLTAVSAPLHLPEAHSKAPIEIGVAVTGVQYHSVVKGDTIQKLAWGNRLNEWQLLAYNEWGKGHRLQIGDPVIIPIVDWSTEAYEGKASWYGPGFHKKKMANGEVYDQNALLIAHRTLPLGISVRITNLNNGKSLVVPVLDRGPYAVDAHGKYSREVDLSKGVAKQLGAIDPGVIPVRIEPLG